MILKRHLLLLLFLLLAFIVNGQNFKVIKENDDYILKEVDSVYYFTHGIEWKDNFVLDSLVVHKMNNLFKMPLDNGKVVELKDKFSKEQGNIEFYHYNSDNKNSGFYLIKNFYPDDHRSFFLLIKLMA